MEKTKKSNRHAIAEKHGLPAKKEKGAVSLEPSPALHRLFDDLKDMILSSRRRVAVAVNSEAISLYWSVGCRIKTDILKGGRAVYGEETIKRCAEFLASEFGSGWGYRTIQHCVRAAYTFSEAEIVYALRTQLSWTHLRSLMSFDDELKLGRFKPEYEGQMRLYLKYLDRNERKQGEESPIGLILCSEGNTEHIEYLMLDEENIRVAQYFTQLPSKELLRGKLQRAVAIAGETLAENRRNR